MLRHYFVLGAKVLLRRKFFTFISLFGIAATLVVFVLIAAILDETFSPGAPESKQDRMLSVQRATMYGPGFMMSSHGGYMMFDRYARDLPGAERLTIFSSGNAVNAFVNGTKVPLELKRTDGEFWQVFDFTFLEGRPYGTQEVDNADFVAVISDSARRRLLGDGPALGRTVEVDGQRLRVAGVVENVSAARYLPFADVWAPHTTAKTPGYRDQLMGSYAAVVLARERGALPGIKAEFNSRLATITLPRGTEGLVAPFETNFEGLARQLRVGDVRSTESQAATLVGIMAVVGVLLAFLPAVNLVNLNISRIMERSSEIGVRKAFGASSRRLVGQFVIENLLLTLIAAAVAFVIAAVVLRQVNQSGVIAHATLGVNGRVFVAGAALAVLFGLASGVYPAWRMSRLHPVNALKGQTR
jgi:putative ABC transport system permease protein